MPTDATCATRYDSVPNALAVLCSRVDAQTLDRRSHQNDAGHADDHSEKRQEAAELVGPDGIEGESKGSQQFVAGTNPVRLNCAICPRITYDERTLAVPGMMLRRLLPVLYAIEFLIALIAVYTVWSEVGGQDTSTTWRGIGKPAIGIRPAAAVVRLTAAIATAGASRRWRITIWALVLAALWRSAPASSPITIK